MSKPAKLKSYCRTCGRKKVNPGPVCFPCERQQRLEEEFLSQEGV